MPALPRIVFYLLFLLSACSLCSQAPDIRQQEWVNTLSEKGDNRKEAFYNTATDLLKLDSSDYCYQISMLEQKSTGKNKHYGASLDAMRGNLIASGKKCPADSSTLYFLKRGLHQAYEIEDTWLIGILNEFLASYHNVRHEHGSAVMYALMAKDVRDKLGNEKFNMPQFSLYNLTYDLYHSRQYRDAIPIGLAAIHLHKNNPEHIQDSLGSYYEYHAWNTIGLSYKMLNQYDSAFYAFDEGLKRVQGDLFYLGLLIGNKGDVYFRQHKYDSAAPLLKYDIENSIKRGLFDNAANSMQRYAQIQAINGDPKGGLETLRRASDYLINVNNAEYKTNLLFAYTQIFKALGQADSVAHYMDQYLVLHDSIEQLASDNRAEIVAMRLDNQVATHKILSLNREKKRIGLIRNLTIALIVVGAAFGYLLLNRSRLKMRLRQQQALEAKKIAEAEYATAREQLNQFTEYLRDKTNLVESLQEQLTQKEVSAEQIEQIQALSTHVILTDEDWEKFKGMFEKVYPGFFLNLKNKVVGITLAEQRMAALTKLQLSTKEAATILGISPNSVHKTRQRLRQRLGLEHENDLDTFFS